MALVGALVRKPKRQFEVVALEEVFKTAVEVDGIPTLENPTKLPKRRPQPRRNGESLEKSKRLQQQEGE